MAKQRSGFWIGALCGALGGALVGCGANGGTSGTSKSPIDASAGSGAGASGTSGAAGPGAGAAGAGRDGAGRGGRGGATAQTQGSGGRGGSGAANAGRGAVGTGGASGTSAVTGASGASGSSNAGAAGAPPKDSSSILAPAQGALLGLYYGDANLSATAQKLGRTPPIHLVYWAWNDDWTGGSTKADLAAGRIPLVNWEPANIDFHQIADGSLDATIKARANGSKALGQKFFLDFAAEMNGDEAWSGNDAPLYVSAYKHIHDLFAAAGASNVIWAWCPNVTDTRGGNAMTLDYYPGDDYVDWTCVDGYNWGSTNGRWQSFKDVFARIYPILAGKGKPIMIGEMASTEQGGDKGAWIDAMIPTLKSDFPMIKALVWFDVNKETDWRISSSSGAEAAFKRLASDPYMNP